MKNRYLFASLAVITLFTFVVTSIIVYVQENYTITKACGCETSIYLLLVLLASIGLFSGSITYYFQDKAFNKEKKQDKQKNLQLLNILDVESKNVLICLIENNGEFYQNKLSKKLKLSNVKIHRLIQQLKQKQIVKTQKHGMTQKIILEDKLKQIFL